MLERSNAVLYLPKLSKSDCLNEVAGNSLKTSFVAIRAATEIFESAEIVLERSARGERGELLG